MNTSLSIKQTILLTIAVTLTTVVSYATFTNPTATFAQDEPTQEIVPDETERQGSWKNGRGNHGNNTEHKAEFAEALGMTVEELETALTEGQTIEEIAAAQGVDLDALKQEKIDEKLQEAIDSGRITEEQAEAIRNGDVSFGKGNHGGQHGNKAEYKAEFAEALGLTVEELETAVADGKTIEEIAAEQGVDLEALKQEKMDEKLQEAIDSGRITEEQAEAIRNGDVSFGKGQRGGKGSQRGGGFGRQQAPDTEMIPSVDA